MTKIKKEVERLQSLSLKINNLPYLSTERDVLETGFWRDVDLLHASADGMVGRHIQFQVADGYAHYIITGATKSTVAVAHLDIGDGYQFSGVFEGKIMRGVADQQLRATAGLKALFSKA